MATAWRWPGPLTRAFLARLFETEIVAGSHDVKAWFIWLMSALAAPGFVLPILLLGWDWGTLGRRFGPDLLDQVAWPDKLLYVGLAIVATGLVAALTWGSLLIDRRDALILGTLPIRPGAIIRAKLTSLALYVLAVATGMHVLASLTFGTLLGANRLAPVGRGIVAHFVASGLASVFVLVSATAAQSLVALAGGPRVLARASAWMQAALVASLLLLMTALPAIGRAVHDELGGARARQVMLELRAEPGWPADVQATATLSPWLMRLPPVWFLGVYETVRGTHIQAFRDAARRGGIAVAALAAFTLFALPLASRRIMTAAVEEAGGGARTGRTVPVSERMVRLQDPRPQPRGLAQLLVLTSARVARHRLVVAAAAGLAMAWSVPALLTGGGRVAGGVSVAAAALPFALTAIGAVALRVAAAIPSDLRAGWVLAGLDVAAEAPGRALRRALWTLVVAPVAIVACGAFVVTGRAAIVPSFLALAAATGLLLVEALLIGYQGLPCAHPWQSERPVVRTWWAVIGAGLLVSLVVPGRALAGGAGFVAAVPIGLLALLTRAASRRVPAREPAEFATHEPSFRLLGLD
ncbi:MAG: hypothetical protein R2752_00295 [Vicinamibacterales bacterium]